MLSTLLIVDDEKHTRDGLRQSFEEDFDVYTAPAIAPALEILQNDSIDVLITDLKLAGESGMSLIDQALALTPPPVIIMMTAYGSVETAVQAMQRGAYDFVTKPLNIDDLEIRVRRALQSKAIEKENRTLKREVRRSRGVEKMLGTSKAMVEVLETIQQVAESRATVLIVGEPGTGKELAAKAIHELSDRADKPLVIVHGAALAPQLLESELFGHEKGAFTGAIEKRIGRFEEADGGTLFLDEIGEIDQITQVKLLRVLSEERSFERLGSNKPIKVDVRLISATNRDLEEMVEEGDFRLDLYHRLNVVEIRMPPLRERREDIPLLADAFLREFARENKRPYRDLSEDAKSLLVGFDWPGNVRQLRSAIEHGVVMSSAELIEPRHLPAFVRQPSTRTPGQADDPGAESSSSRRRDSLNLANTEREMILRALHEAGGNRTDAAKKLGISRRTLHRRLKQFQDEEEVSAPASTE